MKRINTLFLFLGFATGAFAQHQFTVSGYGRVFYEPDAYDLSCGVATEESDIQKCKEAHLAALDQVSKSLDLDKENIVSLKQDATRLETVYSSDKTSRLFRFTTSYTARVKSMTTLVPLQGRLISAGVTDILGLDMFSENLPALVERARKLAIKDAKAKAELAASELGWVLTGASSILYQEPDWYGLQKTAGMYGTREFAYVPNKRPELTTYVSSQVSVTFTFDKNR